MMYGRNRVILAVTAAIVGFYAIVQPRVGSAQEEPARPAHARIPADLDWKAVNRQLEREKTTRRSGPIAENLLRDLGVVAAKIA